MIKLLCGMFGVMYSADSRVTHLQLASYAVTIAVGTPPQLFNVTLNTGISDLWLVNTPNCTGCDPQIVDAEPFDPSKSSSYKIVATNATEEGWTGTPSIMGTIGRDTASIGNLSVDSQTFVAITNTSLWTVPLGSSGYLGLAFPQVGSTNSTPFWQAVINEGQLPQQEMGLWLAKPHNTTSSPANESHPALGGVFTIGGTNTSFFTGDIEFHDAINTTAETPFGSVPLNTWWNLEMTGKCLMLSIHVRLSVTRFGLALLANGKSVNISSGGSAIAVIDSVNAWIAGPADSVKQFWENVPGAEPFNVSGASPMSITYRMRTFFALLVFVVFLRITLLFFMTACNTNVSAAISFGGGKAWSINPADLLVSDVSTVNTSTPMCFGTVIDSRTIYSLPGTLQDIWTLGIPFLVRINPHDHLLRESHDVAQRNVYSVYRANPQSVGFAQLSSAAGGPSMYVEFYK